MNRTLWTNLALSIAAPIIFFLLCEALLLVLGVKPLALTEDPYVGYSGSQPLFIEKMGADEKTWMVTNPVKLSHFNNQSFPRRKPAKTLRIFSLGGSTAYGHPWRDPVSFSGWLRALLPHADSSHSWEVINAGGISYASYREANLMAELIQYQPDLFLIYSGHNEFLEERTYRKTAAIPTVIRTWSARMDYTRTYSALRLVARKLQAIKSPQSNTENPRKDGETDPVLAEEVDDVLAKTIGPTSYTRNEPLKKAVLDHYKISLSRMADLAHSVGAEILFITTPGNEKDCSPFKSEPSPGLLEESKTKVMAFLEKAQAQDSMPLDAIPFYDSALNLDPGNADLAYSLGQSAVKAKLYTHAKSYFQHALNEDICPLRALIPMRQIVLETAQSKNAPYLDFTQILEEKSLRESGSTLLGEPDFVDHVHLSIENYRLLAVSIIHKLDELKVLKKKLALSDDAIKKVSDEIMGKMGSRERGEGLHNLAKVINWAGKHEDAARIAERGLAIDSQGLEAIWSSLILGSALERRGKGDSAILQYKRAVKLDPNNSYSQKLLANALERNPQNGLALMELGRIAQAKGQISEAINYYAQALSLDPTLSEASQALSQLLGNTEGKP